MPASGRLRNGLLMVDSVDVRGARDKRIARSKNVMGSDRSG
jgi:hypothetical protein